MATLEVLLEGGGYAKGHPCGIARLPGLGPAHRCLSAPSNNVDFPFSAALVPKISMHMQQLSSCSRALFCALSQARNMAHRLRPTALQVSGSFLRQACVLCLICRNRAAKVPQLRTCRIDFWWTRASAFAPWSISLRKNGRRAQASHFKSAPFGANIKHLLSSFRDRGTECRECRKRIVFGCLRPLKRPVEVAQFRRKCWRSLAQLA
eukprot:SAG11_NODE_34_length_22265_cov_11.264730_2_plen_207_part_00